MSDNTPSTTSSALASTAVVWAIVALFVATILGSSAVAVFAEGDAAATLVAAMFANLVSIVAVLANLRVTQQVQHDTAELKNGLLDAKVRAGVSDVLHPELLHPDYVETGQRVRDDERRGEAH